MIDTVVLTVTFLSIHIIIFDCLDFLIEHTSLSTIFITSIIRTLLLIPMIGFWMSKVLKVKWAVVCDVLAVIPLLIGGIGCLGCVFTGCCRGYPCEWGIYNQMIQETVFPIQLVNAFIILFIFVYLFMRVKRQNYASDGLSYPIMLVLFGFSRFITEFFCDNKKIFFGLSVLAIHCIKDFIVGMIAYVMIRHKSRRRPKNLSYMKKR